MTCSMAERRPSTILKRKYVGHNMEKVNRLSAKKIEPNKDLGGGMNTGIPALRINPKEQQWCKH